MSEHRTAREHRLAMLRRIVNWAQCLPDETLGDLFLPWPGDWLVELHALAAALIANELGDPEADKRRPALKQLVEAYRSDPTGREMLARMREQRATVAEREQYEQQTEPLRQQRDQEVVNRMSLQAVGMDGLVPGGEA